MKVVSAPDRPAKHARPAAKPAPRGFGVFIWRIFRRAGWEFINDDIPTVAAGATFYTLLAFFPAVGAFVSLYGLVSDIHAASEHLSYLRGFLPPDILGFVRDEMIRITTTHPSRLSGAFLLSLLISIWSANAGVSSLITGLNIAYEQRETRGFIAVHLLSLAITIGALLVFTGAFFLFVAIPILQTRLGLPSFDVLRFFRWPLIFLGTVIMLAAIYYYGPNRKRRARRRIMPGALFASLVWLLVSLGFSWYVGNFGHYDRTYGSLATVMGFLMWMWLGLMVILFGAELNCELEKLG
jgi:membrane protein